MPLIGLPVLVHVVARLTRAPRPPPPPVSAERVRSAPVTVRLTVPLCLGLATCGVQAASLWADAALERGLVRLGATHPRRRMSALAVAASLGMDAAGAHRTARVPEERSTS
ncbi:hypothetical protein ACH9DO_06205 [Kocuria sp. M1N1S27]|uniref:hypothetical protein n=1 Tax=Kocuria kalidii TaxID=3376283 RepID=UPI0037A9C858